MALHPPPPTTDWALYTRDTRRHRLPSELGASFEFESPVTRGEMWCFPLYEVSWGGLSFELLAEVPGVSPGARLGSASARVGRSLIRGELEILHVSAVSGGPMLCGGRFRVATADDERLLERLLERLQRVEAWSLPR